VPAAKVVTGASNGAAIALYEACGFVVADRVEVHDGVASVALVWHADHEAAVRP
jgi:hypothetical protein